MGFFSFCSWCEQNAWIFPQPRAEAINHIVACPLGILFFFFLCPSPLQISTFVAMLTLSDCTQLSIFLFCVLSNRPNCAFCLFIGLSMNMSMSGYREEILKFTIVGTHFLRMKTLCWICSTYVFKQTLSLFLESSHMIYCFCRSSHFCRSKIKWMGAMSYRTRQKNCYSHATYSMDFVYGGNILGLPRWCFSKESTCWCRRCTFDPCVRKIPWSR